MPGWLVVLVNTAAMFLVILVGWLGRRRGLLTSETVGTLSLFTVDAAYPCLVFTQMLKTADSATLAREWYVPALGAALIAISCAVGLAVAPFLAPADGSGRTRSTGAFLVGIFNWVYLPLPIAQALYGNDGLRAVLLMNVGAQAMLWTVGVGILRKARPDIQSLKALASNPGLIGTAAGVLIAATVPGAGTVEDAASRGGGLVSVALSVPVRAMAIVGSLTIPLSLLVTGAQLGGLVPAGGTSNRPLAGVLVARLALGPSATIAVFAALGACGVRIPDVPRMVAYISSAMPVAVSCSILAGRYGGDGGLAARAIVYSTMFGIATVPAFSFAVQAAGL